MNNRQLLINRKFNITEDESQSRVTWYSSLHFLKKYNSIENCDFYDTTSSAGDWSGYIVQKIGNKRYLILFNQSNNWPHGGYTLYTGNIIASWDGKFKTDDILEIVTEHVNQFT